MVNKGEIGCLGRGLGVQTSDEGDHLVKRWRRRMAMLTAFGVGGLILFFTLVWMLLRPDLARLLQGSSVALLTGFMVWRYWVSHQQTTTALETLTQSVARQTAEFEKGLQRDKHWQRFSVGMLIPLHFEPAAAHQGWLAQVSAQGCIERLAKNYESWQRERYKQLQREKRRQHLDLTVALLDFDLDRDALQHGILNAPAVYTEHLLVNADPGAIVLSEVLGLFARRIWLALQHLATHQRLVACAQWDITQMLSEFSSDMRALGERSLLISALIQQSEHQTQILPIASALARNYHHDLAWLLKRAEKITLLDRQSLNAILLASCRQGVTSTQDDLAFVMAAQPIYPCFLKLYTAHLAQLVALADEVERQQGLRPLSAQLRLRQSVT